MIKNQFFLYNFVLKKYFVSPESINDYMVHNTYSLIFYFLVSYYIVGRYCLSIIISIGTDLRPYRYASLVL